MDGTLADTEGIHRLAFNQVFTEFNFDWQWSVEQYKLLLSISGGKERIHDCLQQRQIVPTAHTDLWHLAESVHKRKSEIYREMLEAGQVQLRQGVKRLIGEAVGKNIALAIATSSSAKNVETLLLNTLGKNALALFPVIVTCDIVGDKKPSPAVYQLALAELGLEPDNCIAIEDTCNGNRAAISAHLKTVITTHQYTTDDDFSGAHLVVEQLGEPHQSFTVKAGNAFNKDFVDVELLEHICSDESSSHPGTNRTHDKIVIAAT